MEKMIQNPQSRAQQVGCTEPRICRGGGLVSAGCPGQLRKNLIGLEAEVGFRERSCPGTSFPLSVPVLCPQAGHTGGSLVTCGPWVWCSSLCSTASSPSMTASHRSSSERSRLLSTPSPSESCLLGKVGKGSAGPLGFQRTDRNTTGVLESWVKDPQPHSSSHG